MVGKYSGGSVGSDVVSFPINFQRQFQFFRKQPVFMGFNSHFYRGCKNQKLICHRNFRDDDGRCVQIFIDLGGNAGIDHNNKRFQ